MTPFSQINNYTPSLYFQDKMNIKQFFQTTFTDEATRKKVIETIIMLAAPTEEPRIFVLNGTGSNGKSILSQIIQTIAELQNISKNIHFLHADEDMKKTKKYITTNTEPNQVFFLQTNAASRLTFLPDTAQIIEFTSRFSLDQKEDDTVNRVFPAHTNINTQELAQQFLNSKLGDIL